MIRSNEKYVMIDNFTFKIGMEFSSLKQFKDEVLEHSMLNVKKVRFVKDDGRMCMGVCKHKKKCEYNVLCSRVIRTSIFLVKTISQA